MLTICSGCQLHVADLRYRLASRFYGTAVTAFLEDIYRRASVWLMLPAASDRKVIA